MTVDEFGEKYRIECLITATQGATLVGDQMEYTSVDDIIGTREYAVYNNETNACVYSVEDDGEDIAEDIAIAQIKEHFGIID